MSVKIYKISSTAGEKVYVGSTSKTLEQRWSVHKAPSNDTNSRILFQEYGVDTCSIELLEEVKENERTIRERWWIENTENVVNLRVEGRTRKEYRDEHKEEIAQRMKVWNEKNMEHRVDYSKKYRDENSETLRQSKKEHYESKIDYYKQKNKEYREKNRDILLQKKNEYGSTPTSCPKCSKVMRRDSINKHLKAMHL